MPFDSGFHPAASRSQKVAYFSMEIALDPRIPTYSGGLGVLAGDTLRSMADLSLPVVAVTLAHRRGYFRQHLDAAGSQTESDVPWSPENMLPAAEQQAIIHIQGRDVMIRAWRYDVIGVTGHIVPVYLLDTDIEENNEFDRTITDHLYGGDSYYRLCQEAVLGIGGGHLLDVLGYRPKVFHMNEGHASLLTLGLLEERLKGQPLTTAKPADLDWVRRHCVFTTHTPVPAGHDQFGADQMYQVLGEERSQALEAFGCMHKGLLNMTYIALRFTRYVNGVAMQHGKVSQQMFPDYKVHSITNGVHAATWLSPELQRLFDDNIPNWREDNRFFRSVTGIEPALLAEAHLSAKNRLFEAVAARTGISLRPNVLTLGFARRVATYKRAQLLFQDPERLANIARAAGGLQILYAGKAHPADEGGKQLIRNVVEMAHRLSNGTLQILFLENYDWELGKLLTNGVDVWVNTPKRPYEASGTSGMKAALNGVPSLSVLDGWWIEGCVEGGTGWAIEDCEDEAGEADSLYEKLRHGIIPAFQNPAVWNRIMQQTIAINAAFFNTHRMAAQYVENAYFPEPTIAQGVEYPALQQV